MMRYPQKIQFTSSTGTSCTIEIGSIYPTEPQKLYYCLIKENQKIVAEGALTGDIIKTIKNYY